MAYPARCRIAVRHGRSALTQLGRALQAGGAEPISIDFHRTHEACDVVDLVVELPDAIDQSRLARLLTQTGAGRLLSYLPPPLEPDPIVGILVQCRDLLVAPDRGELDRRAGAAIAGVCGTRTALVSPMPGAVGCEAARFAVERGQALAQRTAQLPSELGGYRLSDAWLLAVPDGRPDPTCVALVARAIGEPFLPTEIARVETILAIRRRLAESDRSRLLTGSMS